MDHRILHNKLTLLILLYFIILVLNYAHLSSNFIYYIFSSSFRYSLFWSAKECFQWRNKVLHFFFFFLFFGTLKEKSSWLRCALVSLFFPAFQPFRVSFLLLLRNHILFFKIWIKSSELLNYFLLIGPWTFAPIY